MCILKKNRLINGKLLFFIVFCGFICSMPVRSISAETHFFKKVFGYNGKIPIRVVKKIDLPRGYHEGVFWDGSLIWVANGKGKKTWCIDPYKGEIVSEKKLLGSFSEAITSTGDDTLWMTDWQDKKIYHFKLNGDISDLIDVIPVDSGNPAGLVYADNKFYVIVWDRGFGAKYYLLEMDSNGGISRKIRIKGIHEPAHIAWDGRHFWITSWYNRYVYKIDPNGFKILGAFRSPADDATGIVWDGKSLWLTGTYADLYQIEISK
ncbi:MAG: hypothetical protein ABH869_04975 [Candidatus Omnitrophota bacterium]